MSCPECESIRSRVRMTGHDADGRRLRYRVCDDCGTKYSTVEAVIPGAASLFVLDGFRKQWNREAMRRKRGYHGGIGGPPLKPEPLLRVRVSLADRRRRSA